MGQAIHLVLIETSGNQAYIFETNKLRENAGASEIAYRFGTEYVLKAVKDNGGPDLWADEPKTLRSKLLDPVRNLPIEQPNTQVEVIVATSGKALLLVKAREVAKSIVSQVTGDALRLAPGLEIYGVISEAFDWNDSSLNEVVRDLHRRYELTRNRHAGREARFPHFPFCQPCTVSGWPAAGLHRIVDRQDVPEPTSAVSLAKRQFRDQSVQRFRSLWQGHIKDQRPAPSTRWLERALESLEQQPWLAVVHADGNGFGRIFLDFQRASGAQNNRQYVDRLRAFSLALEWCTERAFFEAVTSVYPPLEEDTQKEETRPVLPLILGGDDLTVIVQARGALQFVSEYLRAFERLTAQFDITRDIARQVYGSDQLSACAGAAIIKPHFPFYRAYELAEALLASAKTVKQFVKRKDGTDYPCSAFDFHVHYESAASDLEHIRSRLEVVSPTGPGEPPARLWGGPYVVTPLDDGHDIDEQSKHWALCRSWDSLARKIETLIPPAGAESRLPRTQIYRLRSSLFRGRAAADAQLQLVYPRLQDRGLKHLVETDKPGPSLFWLDDTAASPTYHTQLLDAVEASEFYLRQEERPDDQSASAGTAG